MKVRTHDGHFLSHTSDGRVTFDADYSNDTSFAERKRRGSGFSVTEEEGSGGRKQKGNAFQQDRQGVLCNEKGEPVLFEEDEKRYRLKVEKFGPVEYGLKAIDPDSGEDAGQYLAVGFEHLRLRPEPESMAMFCMVEEDDEGR